MILGYASRIRGNTQVLWQHRLVAGWSLNRLALMGLTDLTLTVSLPHQLQLT